MKCKHHWGLGQITHHYQQQQQSSRFCSTSFCSSFPQRRDDLTQPMTVTKLHISPVRVQRERERERDRKGGRAMEVWGGSQARRKLASSTQRNAAKVICNSITDYISLIAVPCGCHFSGLCQCKIYLTLCSTRQATA